MSKLDQYLHAATRDNTRQSYQSAIRHFEVEWGGFLPATADSIARYLADHAETLAINTLRQRLAALAQWHIEQGFPDPTKASVVRKTFRGIKALHPAREKQAKPLQLEQLGQVTQWLDAAADVAARQRQRGDELRHLQQALVVKQEDVTRLNQEGARLVADLSHAQKALHDEGARIHRLEQRLEEASNRSHDSMTAELHAIRVQLGAIKSKSATNRKRASAVRQGKKQ
jgi:hypothetical protein